MDNDRKSTGLKALQGKIWRSGFENGTIKGQYVQFTFNFHVTQI